MGKTNKITIESIKEWLKNKNEDIELISKEYVNNHTDLEWRCKKCDSTFKRKWKDMRVNRGCKCPICETKTKPCKGMNTIEVTHPHMVQYFKNYEDVTSNLYGSEKKVLFKCPCCGSEEYKTINKVLTKGYNCSICGQKASLGERYIKALLNILNVEFKHEYSPMWSNGKRYDFYLYEYNVIIEVHGSQHYDGGFSRMKKGRTLKEEQENDRHKKELALQNGITKYIVIDCRKGEVDYIDDNIRTSELKDILDIDKVLKSEIMNIVQTPLLKDVCRYWEDNKGNDITTSIIAEIFNVSTSYVKTALRKGNKLGICHYDGKEQMIKNARRNNQKRKRKILFQGQIFDSAKDLAEISLEVCGVQLNEKNINAVCSGSRTHHKGFVFAYID